MYQRDCWIKTNLCSNERSPFEEKAESLVKFYIEQYYENLQKEEAAGSVDVRL